MSGIPLGTMASSHQDVAASGTTLVSFNTRTFAKSYQGSTSDTLATSLSAGSVGDIAIFWDRRINTHSTSAPSSNVPSGWTQIGTGTTNAGNEFRHDFCYKVMSSSDISSGTVTSGQAEERQNTILFFTPSQPITSTTVYDFTYNSTAGSPTTITQNITTEGGDAPIIAVGIKTTHGSGHAVNATFNSPSWTETFAVSAIRTDSDNRFNTQQSDTARIGYIIQNYALSDLTVSASDEGNNQQMCSFHLEIN